MGGFQKRSLRVQRTHPSSSPEAQAATAAEFSKYTDYISPTYKSTPLFAPQDSPFQTRSEAPVIPSWGTHVHQYAGIGDLPFLGLSKRERDLYVARSHRHFLSGQSLVRHDQVTPTQITPFMKSLNRACDDLVPPAGLIPLEKYARVVEQTKFVQEDKYASHKERFQVFPQRVTGQRLTAQTAEDIRQLINKRYGQTTYSETYYDQRTGTKLSLGPQFQFYNDGDEEPEQPKQDASQQTTDAGEPQSAEYSKTTNDVDQQPSEDDADSFQTDAAKSQTSEKSTNVQTIDELKKEFAARDEDRPCWPAWPGNQAHCIDPVTRKITEKHDVLCRQDETDVRALPVSKPLLQPDYKTVKSLQQSANDRFAPARTNFAYSGQTVLYGTTDERAQQEREKTVEKVPGCSRFKPVPNYVDENVDRLCSGRERRYMATIEPSRVKEEFARLTSARPPANRLRVRVAASPGKSSSIENLEQTVESLRAASAPSNDQYTKLPPLWESFPGDRVVDRLGVRFMTTAQARYHYSHTDEIPEQNVWLPRTINERTTFYDRDNLNFVNHNPRRRQYYKGHHMGSSLIVSTTKYTFSL